MSGHRIRNLVVLLAATTLGLPQATPASSVGAAAIRDAYGKAYQVETDVLVPMRDGIRLHGYLLRPRSSDGRLPTVLVRTPYELRNEIEDVRFIRAFLDAGFAVLVQNERGRYLSAGLYDVTIVRAREDGLDTLDWVVKQPWSDGTVGTFGCSSSAENQLALMAAGHPAHKAAVPMSAAVAMIGAEPTDVLEPGQASRGGVFFQNWVTWFYNHGALAGPSIPDSLLEDEHRSLVRAFDVRMTLETSEDWPERIKGFPQIDALKRLRAPRTEYETYATRPPASPEWAENRLTDSHDVRVPTLWVSSWFDYVPQLEIGVFEANRRRAAAAGDPGRHKLIVSPGLHCSQNDEDISVSRPKGGFRVGERPVGDPRFPIVQTVTDWLLANLKADPAAAARLAGLAPVSAYNSGSQRWEAAPGWPADDAPIVRFCLGPNSLTRVVEGGCQAGSGTTSYRHDPHNPVPTLGGGGGSGDLGPAYPLGSVNQRSILKRGDVISYVGDPLEKELHLFGNVNLALKVSATTADADVFAKLVEVLPDGRVFNVADTAFRLRYHKGMDREAFLEPGQPVLAELPTMVTNHSFRKGSRLGLIVSSSNWPQFTINTGTRTLPELEANPVSSTITIWHGEGSASELKAHIR